MVALLLKVLGVGRPWGAEEHLLRAALSCRSRDFYHTCYCLSGLSIAQHFGSGAMLHDVVLGVPENALVRQIWAPNTPSPQGPQERARSAGLALYLLCGQAGGLASPPSLGLQPICEDVTVEETCLEAKARSLVGVPICDRFCAFIPESRA